MNKLLLQLNIKWQSLRDEHGQDLIEYALVVALIAFAAVGAMQTLANDINTAFANIATNLNTYS
jgi:pilus assembly protein Flp/PilA